MCTEQARSLASLAVLQAAAAVALDVAFNIATLTVTLKTASFERYHKLSRYRELVSFFRPCQTIHQQLSPQLLLVYSHIDTVHQDISSSAGIVIGIVPIGAGKYPGSILSSEHS